jgi:hypothetical protein
MVLFLGVPADEQDVFSTYQPVTIPDDYPIADVVAIIPAFWWCSSPPTWVASDNAELAQAASESLGGIPIYDLDDTGFPLAPEA